MKSVIIAIAIPFLSLLLHADIYVAPDGDDTYGLRLLVDPTANGGDASESFSYRNISTGGPWTDVAGLQGIIARTGSRILRNEKRKRFFLGWSKICGVAKVRQFVALWR